MFPLGLRESVKDIYYLRVVLHNKHLIQHHIHKSWAKSMIHGSIVDSPYMETTEYMQLQAIPYNELPLPLRVHLVCPCFITIHVF